MQPGARLQVTLDEPRLGRLVGLGPPGTLTTYLTRSWSVLDTHLTRIWPILDPYLTRIWPVLDPHWTHTWSVLQPHLTRTDSNTGELDRTRSEISQINRLSQYRAPSITRHHHLPPHFNNRPTDTPETTAPWIPPWPGTQGQAADSDTAESALPYDDIDLTSTKQTIRTRRKGDRGGYEHYTEAPAPDKLYIAVQSSDDNHCLFICYLYVIITHIHSGFNEKISVHRLHP